MRAVRSAAVALLMAFSGSLAACHRHRGPPPIATNARGQTAFAIGASVYDGGLSKEWQDYGWAPRDLKGPGPASIDFSNYGGWIVASPALHGRFGGLTFRMKTAAGLPELLEVRLDSPSNAGFPRVELRPEHRRDAGDGWVEVLVPMSELNPGTLPFDRVIFRAFRPQAGAKYLLDKIGFTEIDGNAAASAAAKILGDAKPISLRVDCRAHATKISPRIYGTAWDSKHADVAWRAGSTMRRWGGNTTSRYNWELHAWSTAMDWFWENVAVTPYTTFLDEDALHGAESALTVPILGWVAKDTTSSSFPTSIYPDAQQTDSYRPTAGNGKSKAGIELTPPAPGTTSIPAPPAFVERWVTAIRDRDRARDGGPARSVSIYILDNEPSLWNSTHRDVHPEPLTYDELLEKTLAYGAAVRRADPDGLIAGPAAWGWPAYNYSAKDMKIGHFLRPDRRAHGDVPLMAWYLRRLREEEEKTKVHILDLVDVHFYPQAKGLYGDGATFDPEASALRIRSTRALWDPSYVDESYIKEPIALIPRLRDWIAQEYPGRGIEIGEWSFGAEQHMSGGLATAEALGRFGANGVAAAFYWMTPEDGSPSYQAFRAYRNFDGKGGHFLEYSLPASAPEGASIFASRNAAGDHVVAVLLDLTPDRAFAARIDLEGARIAKRTAYVYTAGATDFTPGAVVTGEEHVVKETIPPYSIVVLDIQLSTPLGTPVAE